MSGWGSQHGHPTRERTVLFQLCPPAHSPHLPECRPMPLALGLKGKRERGPALDHQAMGCCLCVITSILNFLRNFSMAGWDSTREATSFTKYCQNSDGVLLYTLDLLFLEGNIWNKNLVWNHESLWTSLSTPSYPFKCPYLLHSLFSYRGPGVLPMRCFYASLSFTMCG